ncbi:MAG: type II toxin-antitoxin system HicB family antitoxin, partial [Veillonella sp.]|nr:type II toxin-antitoxin system HicB family antitoxin [Veillonella sp.]
MRKEMYPAVFSTDGKTGYTVMFPDLLGCVTEGDTLKEAVEMAEDALGIYL